MNVLFLCMDMDGLHGSFLHVMEYGEYFQSKGWHVTIGSVYIGEENRKLAEGKGFDVYRLFQIPDIEYDLVYAMHLFLFPALLYRGLRYKKAISATLSAFLPIEQQPPLKFLVHYDLVTAISQEAATQTSRKFGLNPALYKIIPNPVPLPFLGKANLKTTWNNEIKKSAWSQIIR